MIGRTTVDGPRRLELTLLNPHTTPQDLDALLDEIVSAGA